MRMKHPFSTRPGDQHYDLQVKLVICTPQVVILLRSNQPMQDSKYRNFRMFQGPKCDCRQYDYWSSYPARRQSGGSTQHPHYQEAVHTEQLRGSNVPTGSTIQAPSQSSPNPIISESLHQCMLVVSFHVALLSRCLQLLALLVVELQENTL